MKRALLLVGLLTLVLATPVLAAGLPTINIGISEASEPQQVSTALQILLLLTVLSVAPAILLMTTSFTRIVIVLAFVRQAMGTQQAPSSQIIISLALFLTFFIMAPVWNQMNTQALQPYLQGQISQQVALKRAQVPLRNFMFAHVGEKDLKLLLDLSKAPPPANRDDVPTLTLIPAFMLSELRHAFQMGFLLFIPFLVVDMVVASILMSMGMMMLPPVIISLPFKILLFVLVDGWSLLVGSLIQSFSG